MEETMRCSEPVCVCDCMYVSSLVLLSPTSTVTFYLVSGKAEGALITFTTTTILTLFSPGTSHNSQ